MRDEKKHVRHMTGILKRKENPFTVHFGKGNKLKKKTTIEKVVFF